MQAAYNKVLTEKKKFEADAIAATDELYEAKYELKNAEEKVKNLNSTLLKREEELKQEKEINHELENSRKSLEQQLKDIQTRVEDAEDFAKRETKRISNKFEARVSSQDIQTLINILTVQKLLAGRSTRKWARVWEGQRARNNQRASPTGKEK